MRILVAEFYESKNSFHGGLAQLARALDLHSRVVGSTPTFSTISILLKMFFDILKKIHEIRKFLKSKFKLSLRANNL